VFLKQGVAFWWENGGFDELEGFGEREEKSFVSGRKVSSVGWKRYGRLGVLG
jgi:hypothetical protein